MRRGYFQFKGVTSAWLAASLVFHMACGDGDLKSNDHHGPDVQADSALGADIRVALDISAVLDATAPGGADVARGSDDTDPEGVLALGLRDGDRVPLVLNPALLGEIQHVRDAHGCQSR